MTLLADPDYWQMTADIARALVALHVDAADVERPVGDPDAAWRGVIRDLLDAIADLHDCRVDAVSALAQATEVVCRRG